MDSRREKRRANCKNWGVNLPELVYIEIYFCLYLFTCASMLLMRSSSIILRLQEYNFIKVQHLLETTWINPANACISLLEYNTQHIFMPFRKSFMDKKKMLQRCNQHATRCKHTIWVSSGQFYDAWRVIRIFRSIEHQTQRRVWILSSKCLKHTNPTTGI